MNAVVQLLLAIGANLHFATLAIFETFQPRPGQSVTPLPEDHAARPLTGNSRLCRGERCEIGRIEPLLPASFDLFRAGGRLHWFARAKTGNGEYYVYWTRASPASSGSV